ncbi:MAG: DUF1016 N-terminal domain-containing protein [Verrucomicrobiota bacterium]
MPLPPSQAAPDTEPASEAVMQPAWLRRQVARQHLRRSVYDFLDFSFSPRQAHEAMQRQAARSVNIGFVARNWLFGWYIVEYQQNGADRAEYGERFIDTLAEKLREQGIIGCSSTQLKLDRLFYQQRKQIRQAVSDELNQILQTRLQNGFPRRYPGFLPK